MKPNKHYILKIDSFIGKDTSRDQHQILDEDGWNVQEIDALYAIVCIGEKSAEIIDDAYRSLEEAQASWPNAIPRLRSANSKKRNQQYQKPMR